MRIAILIPNESSVTETFIQNHILHLPFEKVVVFGGKFPFITDTDKPSLILRRWFKYSNKIKRALGLYTQTVKEFYLKKILIKYQVDLVFAEFLITGAEVQHICKQLNIPIIAIALGYEISQYNVIKQYNSRYRSLFKYAKNIIIVSKHMTNNLLKLDCSEHKIVFSPASPSKDFFDLMPNFENKQILAVGRFVNKKAPLLTITAFSKVLDLLPDSKLVMAGDGPLLEDCKVLVKQLGISDYVIFKGKINKEEHKELLETSYMFVQHSIVAKNGDSEGTPVAILEASAAGLPIVSTQHAGIPEVVKHLETGFLVPEHDIDLMAERMVELLKDKSLAIRQGAYGKSFVKSNFTLKQHIDTITNCIRNSINN